MSALNKDIWIYWEQGFDNAPELVSVCVQSWVDANPGWNVVKLDAKSISRFQCHRDLQRPEIRKLGIQHRSDILRLGILRECGGVWADAATFCISGLDDWIHEALTGACVFMFSEPARDKLTSNWFIASEAGAGCIDKLYARLTAYWIEADFPQQGRSASLVARFVNRCLVPVLGKKVAHVWLSPVVRNRLKIYPYFIFHYVVNQLYFEDRQFREQWDRVSKHSADGPHALKRLLEAGHDSSAIYKALGKRGLPPLFKLSWRNHRALPVLRDLQAKALFSG